MKILAIDTATEICGVALAENNELVADCRLNQRNIHNEKLIALIERLINDAGLQLSELDGIALAIGPGSFTGLRIGISAAKGLAFSLEIPIAAVNSLDALAYGTRVWQGQICTVLKVREEELYLALYENSSQQLQRTSDYKIIRVDELQKMIDEKTLLVSSPHDLISRSENGKYQFADSGLCLANPFNIARLGYDKFVQKQTENPEKLEPFYLKEFKPKLKKYYADQPVNN